jgi:DNA-binding CsgD family transcriptional regulator
MSIAYDAWPTRRATPAPIFLGQLAAIPRAGRMGRRIMDPNARTHDNSLASAPWPASASWPSEAQQHTAPPALMLRILDEIDYGLVLLGAGGQVRHANQLALESLRGGGVLMLSDGRLQARGAHRQAALAAAIAAAVGGRRRLLLLTEASAAADECPVALIPLPAEAAPMCLLVMGKRQPCELLSLTFFAQAHGLTRAEVGVLRALCSGDAPKTVARELGVALSTVRTQIGSLRMKTNTHSIAELVRRIAALPPITLALKCMALN